MIFSRGTGDINELNGSTAEQCLVWARSLEGYQRTVRRLVDEHGWPEDAARKICDLTVLAKTKPGRRALAAEYPE